MITVEQLAKILREEFLTWGDIDPSWFAIEDIGSEPDYDYEDEKAMKKALAKVVKKINKESK